ncbi:hypothetical protein [Agarivorans gilvus]|uniref:Uncharacterized protein n=1 Tax=Agarivorans gilvus TaxID=680279 RepID=A0ABQ1I1B3_9ALTE|nr:hypothetical protein [Agarivorans gilvus]GGB02981.1 hypothetical protein GCM10007414_15440 [Agarivorans gilvus]
MDDRLLLKKGIENGSIHCVIGYHFCLVGNADCLDAFERLVGHKVELERSIGDDFKQEKV